MKHRSFPVTNMFDRDNKTVIRLTIPCVLYYACAALTVWRALLSDKLNQDGNSIYEPSQVRHHQCDVLSWTLAQLACCQCSTGTDSKKNSARAHTQLNLVGFASTRLATFICNLLNQQGRNCPQGLEDAYTILETWIKCLIFSYITVSTFKKMNISCTYMCRICTCLNYWDRRDHVA
jgi:hypothetical protein